MKTSFVTTRFTLFLSGFGLAGAAMAQPSSSVCDDDGGPTVCVRFDNFADPPEAGTDFTFSFDGSGIPSVELVRGQNAQGTIFEWRVWSREGSGNPAAIGSIRGNAADDYKVTLLQDDGDPGASNLTHIDLVPADSGNFANLTDGEITGDLTGSLTVVDNSSGTGGEVTFTIGGDADGELSIAVVKALIIEGDATDTITVETVDTDGYIIIKDNLSGDLAVTTLLESGTTLWVWDNVTSTATVTIEDMEDDVWLLFNDISGTFAGDVILNNGVGYYSTLEIQGQLTGTGSIDLQNAGVGPEGAIYLHSAASGASIVNGGTVDGLVSLAHCSGGLCNFSGSATFASVTSQTLPYGQIAILANGSTSSGLDGTVHITGNMAGDVYHPGFVQSAGLIDIDGDCSGEVIIGSLNGDVEIGSDLTATGSVYVDGTVAGDVHVAGDVIQYGTIELGQLGRGRILVDGMMDGIVTINDNTGINSLIHLLGGLDGNGLITINAGENNFNANGNILVGPDTIPLELDPITYDGCIEVLDNGTGGYGDLNGDVTVVGCHATDADLGITIEGDKNGDVNIVQTDCENQVDWSACP